MENIGEPISVGGLSKVEYLVICSILKYLEGDNWDWGQSGDINADEVLTTYDCIVDLVNTLHISLPLFQRPKDKIKKVLHHIAGMYSHNRT